MNSQTQQPLSHEELKKKLEEREKSHLRKASESHIQAAQHRSEGDSFHANLMELSEAHNNDEAAFFRACLTALERGEADTRRLDYIQQQGPPFFQWGDDLRSEIDSAITTSNQQAE